MRWWRRSKTCEIEQGVERHPNSSESPVTCTAANVILAHHSIHGNSTNDDDSGGVNRRIVMLGGSRFPSHAANDPPLSRSPAPVVSVVVVPQRATSICSPSRPSVPAPMPLSRGDYLDLASHSLASTPAFFQAGAAPNSRLSSALPVRAHRSYSQNYRFLPAVPLPSRSATPNLVPSSSSPGKVLYYLGRAPRRNVTFSEPPASNHNRRHLNAAAATVHSARYRYMTLPPSGDVMSNWKLSNRPADSDNNNFTKANTCCDETVKPQPPSHQTHLENVSSAMEIRQGTVDHGLITCSCETAQKHAQTLTSELGNQCQSSDEWYQSLVNGNHVAKGIEGKAEICEQSAAHSCHKAANDYYIVGVNSIDTNASSVSSNDDGAQPLSTCVRCARCRNFPAHNEKPNHNQAVNDSKQMRGKYANMPNDSHFPCNNLSKLHNTLLAKTSYKHPDNWIHPGQNLESLNELTNATTYGTSEEVDSISCARVAVQSSSDPSGNSNCVSSSLADVPLDYLTLSKQTSLIQTPNEKICQSKIGPPSVRPDRDSSRRLHSDIEPNLSSSLCKTTSSVEPTFISSFLSSATSRGFQCRSSLSATSTAASREPQRSSVLISATTLSSASNACSSLPNSSQVLSSTAASTPLLVSSFNNNLPNVVPASSISLPRLALVPLPPALASQNSQCQTSLSSTLPLPDLHLMSHTPPSSSMSAQQSTTVFTTSNSGTGLITGSSLTSPLNINVSSARRQTALVGRGPGGVIASTSFINICDRQNLLLVPSNGATDGGGSGGGLPLSVHVSDGDCPSPSNVSECLLISSADRNIYNSDAFGQINFGASFSNTSLSALEQQAASPQSAALTVAAAASSTQSYFSPVSASPVMTIAQNVFTTSTVPAASAGSQTFVRNATATHINQIFSNDHLSPCTLSPAAVPVGDGLVLPSVSTRVDQLERSHRGWLGAGPTDDGHSLSKEQRQRNADESEEKQEEGDDGKYLPPYATLPPPFHASYNPGHIGPTFLAEWTMRRTGLSLGRAQRPASSHLGAPRLAEAASTDGRQSTSTFLSRSSPMRSSVTSWVLGVSTQAADKLCNYSCCMSCLTVVTSFRWVLIILALLGVCSVVTGIVLGALHMYGSSFLTLSLMFIGLGLLMVIVVVIGWRVTPPGHEPCHLLCSLGNYSAARSTRRFRRIGAGRGAFASANDWYSGMLPPEFNYPPPPPSYQAVMAEQKQLSRQRKAAQKAAQKAALTDKAVVSSLEAPISTPVEDATNRSADCPQTPPPSYRPDRRHEFHPTVVIHHDATAPVTSGEGGVSRSCAAPAAADSTSSISAGSSSSSTSGPPSYQSTNATGSDSTSDGGIHIGIRPTLGHGHGGGHLLMRSRSHHDYTSPAAAAASSTHQVIVHMEAMASTSGSSDNGGGSDVASNGFSPNINSNNHFRTGSDLSASSGGDSNSAKSSVAQKELDLAARKAFTLMTLQSKPRHTNQLLTNSLRNRDAQSLNAVIDTPLSQQPDLSTRSSGSDDKYRSQPLYVAVAAASDRSQQIKNAAVQADVALTELMGASNHCAACHQQLIATSDTDSCKCAVSTSAGESADCTTRDVLQYNQEHQALVSQNLSGEMPCQCNPSVSSHSATSAGNAHGSNWAHEENNITGNGVKSGGLLVPKSRSIFKSLPDIGAAGVGSSSSCSKTATLSFLGRNQVPAAASSSSSSSVESFPINDTYNHRTSSSSSNDSCLPFSTNDNKGQHQVTIHALNTNNPLTTDDNSSYSSATDEFIGAADANNSIAASASVPPFEPSETCSCSSQIHFSAAAGSRNNKNQPESGSTKLLPCCGQYEQVLSTKCPTADYFCQNDKKTKITAKSSVVKVTAADIYRPKGPCLSVAPLLEAQRALTSTAITSTAAANNSSKPTHNCRKHGPHSKSKSTSHLRCSSKTDGSACSAQVHGLKKASKVSSAAEDRGQVFTSSKREGTAVAAREASSGGGLLHDKRPRHGRSSRSEVASSTDSLPPYLVKYRCVGEDHYV